MTIALIVILALVAFEGLPSKHNPWMMHIIWLAALAGLTTAVFLSRYYWGWT